MQEVQVWSLVGELRPHLLWPENQNMKQEEYCNKFHKDFKNGPHQKKKKKKKSSKNTQSQEKSLTGWHAGWNLPLLPVNTHAEFCVLWLVIYSSNPAILGTVLDWWCGCVVHVCVCVCYNCPVICYSQWPWSPCAATKETPGCGQDSRQPRNKVHSITESFCCTLETKAKLWIDYTSVKK